MLLLRFLTLQASFGHNSPLTLKHQEHLPRVRVQMQDKYLRTSSSVKYGSSRIWDVVEHLEKSGLTTSNDLSNTYHKSFNETDRKDGVISTIPTSSVPHHEERLKKLTKKVAQILRQWGKNWADQPEWQTLLNKKSLLHEVEESIVALSFFYEWLETYANEHNNTRVILVDVCCGKGILSMLASYLFQGSHRLSSIIMLDKQTDINWNHIAASNDHAKDENRPFIQTWGGCNLNEIDDVLRLLEKENCESNVQYALIGIHLCKLLSPSCAGLANVLGQDKCPFLCLAPCCLPRAVLQSKTRIQSRQSQCTVSVRSYETSQQREDRQQANKLRAGAKLRSFRGMPCFLCADTGHPINRCALLPSDTTERLVIFEKAAAQTPCWKCGELGHVRANCTSKQVSSKPPMALPPTVELDVSSILKMGNFEVNKAPFQTYCELLASSIDRKCINVYDVGLVNMSAQHNNPANVNNWNRDRKSIYIVAK